MSERKWTNGPWETHASVDESGYPVVYIHGFSGDEKRDLEMNEANARLIAAAPDLYEALAKIIETQANPESVEHGYALHDGLAALRKADGAAIATSLPRIFPLWRKLLSGRLFFTGLIHL